ncbi:MAG: glycosyltransferase family 4 protein [Thermoflexus sp.]|nr:glycosyltransferase family 4 protein [Thermoflexus sp.]MDT7949414.1 glycosyltransferase family 4 protein [Thermoflexus sp.]
MATAAKSLSKDITNSLSEKRFVFFSQHDFNLYRFRMPVMQALRERGAQVWAICPPGEYSPRFREHGIEFVPISLARKTFNPLRAWTTVNRLRSILRELWPDVLHTSTLRPNVYGALAGWLAGVPVIVCTVEGLGTLYTNHDLKTRLLRWGVEQTTRLALRAADAIIFLNPDDQSYYLSQKLCRPEQARLIVSAGIDVKAFSPDRFSLEERQRLRQERGLSPDAVVVTMIARLIAPKGVREFLQAAERLNGKARFVLIGEPDPGNFDSLTWEEIQAYVRRGLVLAPGWQNDVLPWLAITDVFVLPSYREGTPVTVLEAMAMGLPVVATDVPGCREAVVAGETGFLVPPRNVDELVQAIRKLVEDPALRRRMGQAGRARAVQRFAIERITAQYLDLYAELLRGHAG